MFLIPVPISGNGIPWSIPLKVSEQIVSIQHFIVENEKTARHYLKQLNPGISWDKISLLEMDKHNMESRRGEIRNMLLENPMVGLMSEAGLPCIADPGNHVVRMAHELEITVKPLTGPSSILLALIASGLNGQQFKFNGYIPVKPEERRQAILRLEKESGTCTQLFIEAPYRNDKMFADLLAVLNPSTRLLIAVDLTGDHERIMCRTVSWWKDNRLEIGKIPCMFGLGL